MARTEREEEQEREMADLLVLSKLADSLQNGASFSGRHFVR